jgi:malate dehydrogenase
MYPDISSCKIAGKDATKVIDKNWYETEFIPKVQQRGTEVIQARKLSSAASAGSSALDHVRDWVKGSGDEWVAMAVPSDGSYGIPEGVMFSYPIKCPGDGSYKIV